MNNDSLQLIRQLAFDEVIERINHAHSVFPGSHWYAVEKSRQYSENAWYEAMIPGERIASLIIYEPHLHDNGKTILIRAGETILQAANGYKNLIGSKNMADKECYQKIEAIRQIIRSGQDLEPLVLTYNKQDNTLAHIDGLHRMVAWTIELPGSALKALVAIENDTKR